MMRLCNPTIDTINDSSSNWAVETLCWNEQLLNS